jgi:hypothetical protein
MADDLSPLAAALRAAWSRGHGTSISATTWEAVATAAREHLRAAPPAPPPERPTCATCPYWRLDRMAASAAIGDHGECRRHSIGWIGRLADKWCGDHPAFPAWIAAREGGR